MGVDRRRQSREAHARQRTLDLLLLTVVVLLIATGGALWITSGSESRTDPTAAPTVLVMAPTKAGPNPTKPATTATPGIASVPLPTQAASGGRPQINQPAPDFKLKDLEGRQVSLSDYQGQVVLLNFWATWCGPCRKEIPDIRTVYNSYKDKGFVVIAVDIGETATVVSSFAKQFEMNFPILLDSNMVVARQYDAFSIPTSLFLDRQGVIREIRIGAMSQTIIEQAVAKLLKGTTP